MTRQPETFSTLHLQVTSKSSLTPATRLVGEFLDIEGRKTLQN